jgi:hypothetical protein
LLKLRAGLLELACILRQGGRLTAQKGASERKARDETTRAQLLQRITPCIAPCIVIALYLETSCPVSRAAQRRTPSTTLTYALFRLSRASALTTPRGVIEQDASKRR